MISFTTTFTLATLLTSALSLPASAPAPADVKALEIEKPNSWPVTNFLCPAGSPAGCVYSFNIVYTPPPTSAQFVEPPINTFCNGTNIQENPKPCEDPSITTNVVNGFLSSTLIIEHKWNTPLDDGSIATVWIVGNYTWHVGGDLGFTPPTTFEVPQLELYAIA